MEALETSKKIGMTSMFNTKMEDIRVIEYWYGDYSEATESVDKFNDMNDHEAWDFARENSEECIIYTIDEFIEHCNDEGCNGETSSYKLINLNNVKDA